jgi:hypothetical protein
VVLRGEQWFIEKERRMRSRNILSLLVALGLAVCTMAVRAEEKKEEKEADEVKVKFDDCPAAVKATITKEAEGAKVDTVDKETDDGKTIYEADAKINGTNYEIKVAEDGKLISKKIDAEEDEEKGEKK